MRTEAVDYSFEGIGLQGYLAVEDGAKSLPGILVIHDAGGLSDNIKDKAGKVAELGYCAFALDLFGGGQRVTDGMARISAMASDFARWRAITKAGLDVLTSRPECDPSRVAAMGYCFGGTTVYELARSGANLRGVVGFHSGLVPSSGETKNIRGKVLTLIGADDPIIPPDVRMAFEKEMTAAKVNWQMTIYGNTGHSFTNPNANAMNRPGFFYEPQSDARSWAAMKAFFAEIFAQP
jgi:dienelactone hydrolase